MKDLEKLIMEMVTELHAPTALPPVLYGYEARMIRMECTTPDLLGGVARVSIKNELVKLFMEFVSQLHAPTAIPPVLNG
jgi:hypothetical protein